MGFFSSLGSAISSGFQKAKSALGRGIEAAGRVIPGKLGDKLEEIGFNMQYPKSHYDSSSSDISATVDINDECKKATIEVKDLVEGKINDKIKDIKSELRKAIRDLQVQLPSQLNIDTTFIDSSFENIGKDFRDYVAKHISIDNESFCSIAKIRDKTTREEKSKEYVSKVASEAFDQAQRSIQGASTAVYEKVLRQVQEFMDAEAEKAKQREEMMKQLLSDHADKSVKAQLCVDFITNISYLECLRNICAEG